jgi:pimeloyl-ACP methyl ester carboxylesterase
VTFHVRRIGTGPALVLVHGSVQNSVTWAGQESLADELTLVLPDRPGYPPNPPLQRIDFAGQAADMAALLGDVRISAGSPTAASSRCSRRRSGPRRCAR